MTAMEMLLKVLTEDGIRRMTDGNLGDDGQASVTRDGGCIF